MYVKKIYTQERANNMEKANDKSINNIEREIVDRRKS